MKLRSEKRDENRKRTTIRYFVDAIDRELYLTPEQCNQLEASLRKSGTRPGRCIWKTTSLATSTIR